MAIIKNSLEIGSDQKFLHDASAGHGVFDVVANQSAIITFLKGMFVDPKGVGAFGLSIDETVRRLPDGDLTLPANRYAAKAQPIV